MKRRDYLGELEQTVLLAVAGLDDEAYGMSIRREIERRSGRNAAIGAVSDIASLGGVSGDQAVSALRTALRVIDAMPETDDLS